MTDIAVVIVAGVFSHKEKWLKECIQSIKEQSVPASELIIVDNIDMVYENDLNVIRAPGDLGKATLYNLAIAQTTSDWIMLVMPDDRLGSYCIGWMKAKIEQIQEWTGDEYFFLRFPVRIGNTQNYFVSGSCFHRQLWTVMNGFFDEHSPESQFTSATLSHRHFKLYDANWREIIGDPLDYYVQNIYPEPYEVLSTPAPIALEPQDASMRERAFANTDNIKMSVITPVGPYKSNKKWLKQCIDSVQQQTKQPFEHILVADMAALRARKGTKIVRSSVNLGVGGATNLGIEHATGDWMLILNSDDQLGPRCIELLSAKINFLSEKTGHHKFFLRFPVCRDIDGVVLLNGMCFHKDVWESAGRIPTDKISDLYFISNVILDPNYPLYDENWIVQFGDSKEYLIHRVHPDQWSIIGTGSKRARTYA